METNWAGNLRYARKRLYIPESVEQAQHIIRNAEHITALGSRHSFNTIADNADSQVSLEKLNNILSLDTENMTVTIESGVRYSELAPYLHEKGFALHNMASLPHITVAGAIATATHGSGLSSGNLATAVQAIEFIDAGGNLVTLTKKDEAFYGAVIGLGALGVVTTLTLAIEPTFQMKQVVYKNLPLKQLQGSFDDLQAKGYSVSLFTDWRDKNINEVWLINKVTEGDISPDDLDLYGTKPATEKTHPVPGQSTEPLTDQLGIPGPWFERMPHFKVGFQPSMGNELQSEYFVPIENAYEAMMAIEELHDRISPHLYTSEIRTVGADELWMSPSYQRTCVALHTTWIQKPEVTSALIPLLEEKLEPFRPIPHWAKLFTMQPEVIRSRYPKLDDFRKLANIYDPAGKFRNEFLKTTIFD